MSDDVAATPVAVVRDFVGRTSESEEALSGLTGESQAALRQFSLERVIAYGLDYADAVELRGRVLGGASWREAATLLAQTALNAASSAGDGCAPTRAHYLDRASALVRMSQMMMLVDDDDRRAVYAHATEHYAEARRVLGDAEHVTIDSEAGALAGWILPAANPVGSAVVVGGVEGWSMDFDSIGRALAARGVTALMLDAPGQGETRFTHHHYLTTAWRQSYRRAVDLLEARVPQQRVGIVGNSMGGSFAMAAAVDDARIAACCNNGGVAAPGAIGPAAGTFFTKMMAVCGVEDAGLAMQSWSSVTPTADGPNAGYPLLMVHGGRDPMISTAEARDMFDATPTHDKQMVVFSDGDHCVYNHRTDRDILIADWMRSRLTESPLGGRPGWGVVDADH